MDLNYCLEARGPPDSQWALEGLSVTLGCLAVSWSRQDVWLREPSLWDPSSVSGFVSMWDLRAGWNTVNVKGSSLTINIPSQEFKWFTDMEALDDYFIEHCRFPSVCQWPPKLMSTTPEVLTASLFSLKPGCFSLLLRFAKVTGLPIFLIKL